MRTLFILALLATSSAHADETAKQHYERGAALYDATRYESALHEFEVAYTQTPLPALVYNIARCLDQLGRREEAVAAYARFLDVDQSDGPQASEVRVRLAEIRTASSPPPPPVIAVPVLTPATAPAPLPSRRRYLAPGILAGGTIVLGAIGAGLLGSALSDYNSLSSSCAPNCSSASWAALPAREHAGEALLGIAGAAAVVDVVLFVIATKKGRK